MIFHPLNTNILPPERFNNPFYYEPHQLCIMAANEVQRWLSNAAEWRDEIAKGKMFGVLVVRDKNGEMGFLAAYSGQIDGRGDWDRFVPAVFDYLEDGGYFKTHEQSISDINAEVDRLQRSDALADVLRQYELARETAEKEINDYRKEMDKAKKQRDEARSLGTSDETERELIRESQHMKAELRRIKKRTADMLADKKTALDVIQNEINKLKKKRKEKSDALQNWLFDNFNMLNAHGERRTLTSIFADTVQRTPPAGAGECCAPKLLQHAYLHTLQPLCMAEFWWGESPKTEIRHHLHYYPACQGKCKPILAHMLQGLDVESNPLDAEDNSPLEIIYEDQYLAVVNKPSGMLSVPGKSRRQSVYSIMRDRWPDADGPMIVHRLDMATSGLLIVARTKDVHMHLQRQFCNREIHKRYIALLPAEGKEIAQRGTIDLPLSADTMDRPRQKVDHEHGKPAVTTYEILEKRDQGWLVALYPHTGRTHQLRVHCAHHDGLVRPIIGDELYGHKSSRLHLHAEAIEFVHPVTGEKMKFESQLNTFR